LTMVALKKKIKKPKPQETEQKKEEKVEKKEIEEEPDSASGSENDQAEDAEAAPVVAPAVDAGWKGLCRAFANILARSLVSPGALPVLCETEIEKKLGDKKREFKEKKMISLARKAEKNKGHTKVDNGKSPFDLNLRRIATQGVVSLFNAVREFQSRGLDDEDEKNLKKETKKLHIKQRSKHIADASKEKFEKLLNNASRAKRDKVRRKEEVDPMQGVDLMDEFA